MGTRCVQLLREGNMVLSGLQVRVEKAGDVLSAAIEGGSHGAQWTAGEDREGWRRVMCSYCGRAVDDTVTR